MAEHMLKKYIAKVEKTVYVVEELEIIAETERMAEEMLDDYCCGEDVQAEVVDIEEQEFVIDHSWIDSSEELGVSEFMKLNGGQTLVRD
jgi:hypothetical protein